MNHQPTVVYFVRHGQTAANAGNVMQGQTDVPLDETGLLQADIVAERLKNFHFDVICSSDLSRALVTAKKIARNRDIIVTPQLREWNLGHWQGKSMDVIRDIYREEFQIYKADDPAFTVVDGESSLDFKIRVETFMQQLASDYPGKTILCVSHGGFITKALKYVLQIQSFQLRPRIFNTSISCFSTPDHGSSWQLVFWNDASHLDAGLESRLGTAGPRAL